MNYDNSVPAMMFLHQQSLDDAVEECARLLEEGYSSYDLEDYFSDDDVDYIINELHEQYPHLFSENDYF